MQHPTVEKLFREQLEYYSRRDQSARQSPIISLFLEWTRKKSAKGRSAPGGKKLKIAEFGGAAGQLLAQINRSYPQSSLTNIEIIDQYRTRQVSPKITFIHGSILNNNLTTKSFDALIIRDVLHHLVGKNYQETLSNQKRALKELWRLLKPGGAIFIEELVDESIFAARLVYILSKLNSHLGFNWPALEINAKSIVAFLTPPKLVKNAREIFGKNNLKKINYEGDRDWRQRISHLGSSSGKMILVVVKK